MTYCCTPSRQAPDSALHDDAEPAPDVDFRPPTSDELDALEAFMLSLGRQKKLAPFAPDEPLECVREALAKWQAWLIPTS